MAPNPPEPIDVEPPVPGIAEIVEKLAVDILCPPFCPTPAISPVPAIPPAPPPAFARLPEPPPPEPPFAIHIVPTEVSPAFEPM